MNSITARLLFAVLVTATVILLLISAMSYFLLQSQEQERFESTIKALDDQLLVIMKEPIFSYDLEVLNNIVKSYLPNDYIARVTVEDQKAREMVSVNADRNIHETSTIPVYYADDEKLIGTIKVAYSRDPLNAALSNNIIDALVKTLLTLGMLSVFLVLVIRQVLVNPIARVSAAIAGMNTEKGFDLTKKAPVSRIREIGSLARTYNHLIDAVSDTLSNVAKNIDQVSNWLQRFDVVCQHGSEATLQQQRITETSLDHLRELRTSIDGVVQRTDETALNCNESLEVARSRREDVQKNLQLVQELVSELDANANKANELKESSNTIVGVLDVIKSIAEQTNLLALNAAIEAARAGESGRGFAVVADEVRTLAQRTQESTTEIEQIIDQLHHKTEEAFNSSQNGLALANDAIHLTEESAESFNYIAEKIASINNKVREVVDAANQQYALSEEVNNRMEDALSCSENLSKEVVQMNLDSKQVAEAERQLHEGLSKFTF